MSKERLTYERGIAEVFCEERVFGRGNVLHLKWSQKFLDPFVGIEDIFTSSSNSK